MNPPSRQLLGSAHLSRELQDYGIWSEKPDFSAM